MKNFLIVGASSGIGLTLARELAGSGHTVTGTYLNHPCEDEERLSYHRFDATEESTPGFIPPVLDGLVYCPGAILLKPFQRVSTADYEAGFRLQVSGAAHIIRQALPALKASGHASVVLFSTVAVQTGMAFHTQVAACKGAVEGLCRALAAEFAPQIRFNCVAPSLTDTPLASSLLSTEEKRSAAAQRHPMKRTGKAEDISAAVRFLLSDESSWMTGQVLHVDGGMSVLR